MFGREKVVLFHKKSCNGKNADFKKQIHQVGGNAGVRAILSKTADPVAYSVCAPLSSQWFC